MVYDKGDEWRRARHTRSTGSGRTLMTAGRSILAIAVFVLVGVGGYFGVDVYTGKRLVKELCAKDGGLKIHKTIEAKGYLDETIGNPLYCYECFWRLAKHQFEYIDVHVAGDPATTPPQAIRPGYYRFSVAPRSDPRCDRWSKNVNLAEWSKQQLWGGMTSAQCVAVDELTGLPAEPALTKQQGLYPNGGAPHVEIIDVSITDSTTDEQIAHLRNYTFTSKFSRLSWDPPESSASCDISLNTYARITNLEPITRASR
jgi:hypothetical protein